MLAFIDHYNRTIARPFEGTYKGKGLTMGVFMLTRTRLQNCFMAETSCGAGYIRLFPPSGGLAQVAGRP